MDQHNGLDVPESLADACRPDRLALLVYDMQVGILAQIPSGDAVVQRVREALEAARAARHAVAQSWPKRPSGTPSEHL